MDGALGLQHLYVADLMGFTAVHMQAKRHVL